MAATTEEVIVGNGEMQVVVGQDQQQTTHLVNGPTIKTSSSSSPARSSSRPLASGGSHSSNSNMVVGGGSSKQDYMSISQLYTDRSVFITGGTGFMGKVLVEKLLRSCPGIKNIYLLIRPKKGQETSARLNDLLNAPVSGPSKMAHVLHICNSFLSASVIRHDP